MAIVATPDPNNVNFAAWKRWSIAALTGDSGEVLFAHGFVDVNGNDLQPADVFILPNEQEVYAGEYFISTISNTQIGITKGVAAASTDVTALIVIAKIPHTSITS